MIGILFTAVLSSSSGQVPGMNPMDNNMQMLIQNGIVAPGSPSGGPPAFYPYGPSNGMTASGGGYGGSPAFQGGYASGSVGNFSLNAEAFGPACNRGSYCRLLGTYIGPYPTGSCGRPVATPCAQQCMPGGYGGGMGGYPGGMMMGGYPGGMMGGAMMGPPIVLPPGYSLVADQDKDKVKEGAKEINRHLEEVKSTLEREIKTNFEKLSDSLKQMEKRLEASEKSGQATEADVKWLKEQVKERLYWHDMENKLDQRIKPLEEKLKDINKTLEKSELRHQQLLDEWHRRQVDDVRRKGGSSDGKNEDVLKSIETKIDTLQTIVSKDISNILMKLEDFDKALQEERVLRLKIEDRLKNLEKNIAPKDKDKDKEKEEPKEAPKDKDAKDREATSKNRVAQVSLSKEGVPSNKALVVVALPAEAKLFLNDQLTRAQGTQRSFMTPPLDPGGTFTYTLRMELVQNGFLRTQTQQVTFQAGQRVNVVFGSSDELRVAAGQK